MLGHTRLTYVLSWLLMIAVFLICVSPAVDLDDCSPSPDQAASLWFWFLSILLLLTIKIRNREQSTPVRRAFVNDESGVLPSYATVVDLTGARRI